MSTVGLGGEEDFCIVIFMLYFEMDTLPGLKVQYDELDGLIP